MTNAVLKAYYNNNVDDPNFVVRHLSGFINGNWTQKQDRIPTRLHELKGKKVIGWKKCGWYDERLKMRRYALVELEIAARTPRVQPKNHKCRAASAKVLRIFECAPGKGKRYNLWKLTGKKLRRAVSYYNGEFVYRVGERVKPLLAYEEVWDAAAKSRRQAIKGSDKFVCDHRECAPGIHFFLTQKEAQGYAL